jgi:nitrite reductase (NO-forming)
MAYFDVVDASTNAVDGKDIAKTKSIDMWEWQKDLFTKLQAADSDGAIMRPIAAESAPVENSHLEHLLGTKSTIVETTLCEIEEGSAMKSTNKSFYPQQIKVNVGDTVKWANNDTSIHTVTSTDGLFDSGMMMANDKFEYTFVNAGNYDYYCMLHPWMKGSVQSL